MLLRAREEEKNEGERFVSIVENREERYVVGRREEWYAVESMGGGAEQGRRIVSNC